MVAHEDSAAVRRLARLLSRLDSQVKALGTTPQLTRSSVPVMVDGVVVPVAVPEAIGKGVQAGVEVGAVREALDLAKAELEAAQAVLDDKLVDAELGLVGANERLDEAETQITDAFGQIDTAQTTADTAINGLAQVSAGLNRKPNIYYSTSEPGSTQLVTQSVWFQVDASGSVIGQWQQVGGIPSAPFAADWEKRDIRSEVIANLDVGKLTAGTAVINELVAQKIAVASGQFLELDVGQLFASSAVIDEGVINKLFADVVVAKTAIAEAFIGGNAILTGAITAEHVAARSITAEKLTLTPGNMVDDPGFTRTFGETWAPYLNTPPTIAAHVDLPGNGLRFSTIGSARSVGSFEVIPGEEYALAFRSTSGFSVSFRWLDTAGGDAGSSGVPSGAGSGFENKNYVIEAPATAVRAFVVVSRTASGEGWIGKIQVRPAVGASLLVDGAIDGKTITGADIRTAATGTRMRMTADTNGDHGLWLYDSNGAIRGSMTGNAGAGSVFALKDSAGVSRMNLTQTALQFWASTGELRTNLNDTGLQFTNNARLDFYGTVDRYGILERISGGTGMTLWGGNGTENVWAHLKLQALSDGPAVYVQGVYDRTTSNPGNIRMSDTAALYRSTSVKSAKIDVTDAHSPGLLNIAYRSWIDKQEMIDAVLGRDADPDRRVVGAVAEEMEQVAPELCMYDSHGNLTGIAYERVALALIPFLRDLTNRVETLEGADVTVWPMSPTYDDTALLDEVTAYGLEVIEPPAATVPPEVVDE